MPAVSGVTVFRVVGVLVLRVVDLGHTGEYIPHGGICSQ
jgi:hypothetical protein